MMAMQELFTYPWLAAWLRGVGVFPVNRFRADIKAVRIALRRLQRGGTVVVFPEAGIRTGADSVLGGATIKRGAAGLAQVTGVSVIPCLSIGSDQLYDPKQWFQRPRMIFYLGSALHADQRLKKREARMALTEKIGQSLRTMYHQLEREGALTSDLVPRSAQERWQSVPESTGSMLAEE
jgi:1-acyl-sn-glycerol-3-phosphate acyltransferase